MLIIMAIDAQILPVTPVRRIVVVVVIFVVDRKHMEVLVSEISAAAGTYQGMNSQRLLAVSSQTLALGLTSSFHYLIDLFLAQLVPLFYIPISITDIL